MKKECICLLRDLLWRCFWVGFLLTFAMGIIWITSNEPLSSFANQIIGIDKMMYDKLWYEFITYAKIVVFYIFLVPAIATSCMCRCQKKEEE